MISITMSVMLTAIMTSDADDPQSVVATSKSVTLTNPMIDDEPDEEPGDGSACVWMETGCGPVMGIVTGTHQREHGHGHELGPRVCAQGRHATAGKARGLRVCRLEALGCHGRLRGCTGHVPKREYARAQGHARNSLRRPSTMPCLLEEQRRSSVRFARRARALQRCGCRKEGRDQRECTHHCCPALRSLWAACPCQNVRGEEQQRGCASESDWTTCAAPGHVMSDCAISDCIRDCVICDCISECVVSDCT